MPAALTFTKSYGVWMDEAATSIAAEHGGAHPRKLSRLLAKSPILLMMCGGLSVLLGMLLVHKKGGNEHLDSDEQTSGEDSLMDILGKSIYADITGPFPVDRDRISYAECLLRGHFDVSGVSGSCEDLRKASMFVPSRDQISNNTALRWDVSACAEFLRGSGASGSGEGSSADRDDDSDGDNIEGDDINTDFLQRRTVYLRPMTADRTDVLDALCGEDAGFLPILARYLPTDRPLLTLDAGAHIGAETLLFALFSRFRGKILAVEAHPETADALRSNTGAGPSHYISRIQAVLTSNQIAAEWPTLVVGGPPGQFSRWRVQGEPGASIPGAVEVPTITLQRVLDFTRRKNFDVVKLDLGGMEGPLLEDRDSRAILCRSTCLVVTLEDEDSQQRYDEFVASGCPSSHRLVEAGTAGRYRVLCQEKTVRVGMASENVTHPSTGA